MPMRGCHGLVALLLLAAIAAEYTAHDSTEAGAVVTGLDDGKLDQLMQEMEQLKEDHATETKRLKEENQERKDGHREVTEKLSAGMKAVAGKLKTEKQPTAKLSAGMKAVVGKLNKEKQSTAKLSAGMKAVAGKLKTEKQSTAKLSAEVRTLKAWPKSGNLYLICAFLTSCLYRKKTGSSGKARNMHFCETSNCGTCICNYIRA